MKPVYVKVAVGAMWISTALAIGIALPVTSPLGWAALALGAVLPLVGFARLSAQPPLTMSETIQKALR
jgi:hypothetical protein